MSQSHACVVYLSFTVYPQCTYCTRCSQNTDTCISADHNKGFDVNATDRTNQLRELCELRSRMVSDINGNGRLVCLLSYLIDQGQQFAEIGLY